MKKEDLERLLTLAMSTGADFAEIYFDDIVKKNYILNDSRLDSIKSSNVRGIGIRIIKNDDCFYSSTNNLEYSNVERAIRKLVGNINGKCNKSIKLNKLKEYNQNIDIPHDKLSVKEKKEILLDVDKIIRDSSNLITQVSTYFLEDDRKVIIANSEGKYVSNTSCRTRFVLNVFSRKEDIKENTFWYYGKKAGYEFLEDFDIKKRSLEVAKDAVEKLDAQDFKGGEMPVVIAPGFGAIIFHEACGHGLEATSVATSQSVFTDDLNKKIATDKVTLIDDGTIDSSWGSNAIDDEGELTEKNILIENGILKEFLIDRANSKKMHMRSNGCCRRQNYEYAPTSRMSNTYLAPGTDKLEDMISSIDLGVYCKNMSGGTVVPATGDFNFAVDTAFLIKNGQIAQRIKGITLIGNSKNILNNVEMVGSDLEFSTGYCGSDSGMIYVTVGQPSIKISKILVGGRE